MKGHLGDQGTGAPLLWGKAEGVVTAQLGEETGGGGGWRGISPMSINT